MQSQTNPEKPVLSQEQDAPQPSSSSKPIDPDTDIGEPYTGGVSGSSSGSDPAINNGGGGNQK